MAPMVDSGGRHLGLMLTLRSVDSGVDPGTLPVTITAPVIRASAGLTRIAVLSGDPIFRRGILDVVRVSSLVRIVMDARQVEELGTPGLAKEVDVVLVDAGQYDEAPASMWAAIDAIGEAVPLLFVSSRAEGAAIQEAAWRGHSCLLLTIDHSGPLVRACADVAAGKGFVSPVFLPYVRKGSTEPRSRDLRDRLSERERVVLLGIQVGKPLKTIAAELQVSTKTISTYRRRVLAKLGLRSNAELVLYPSRQKPS
jgi:DNA-binding NarL/FixJ family response regulator